MMSRKQNGFNGNHISHRNRQKKKTKYNASAR